MVTCCDDWVFMHCPTCKGELVDVVKNNVSLNACNSCGGVWLDPGGLDALASASLEADLYHRATAPSQCRYCQTPLGFSSTCSSCGREGTIDCVHGHGVMKAEIVELPNADFEIDVCSTCRCTWVDGQEVGGMERAAVTARRDQFLTEKGSRPYDVIEFVAAHAPAPTMSRRFESDQNPLQFGGPIFSPMGHVPNPISLIMIAIFVALFLAFVF